MKSMAQHIITQKLKQLTIQDIKTYSTKYGITVSDKEAAQIVGELKSTSYNPLKTEDRMKMLKRLGKITSPQTAQKVNRILHQLAKEHGVENWLK
ncbi:DUF2624 family protein [Thalassobacillus hwangdonensis]|uniref:DUF2624 family protein n=1 Tax=Thalassobacillus hwangdonensis TaxID=546108 RepID=A0ABW3KZ00_9BACI